MYFSKRRLTFKYTGNITRFIIDPSRFVHEFQETLCDKLGNPKTGAGLLDCTENIEQKVASMGFHKYSLQLYLYHVSQYLNSLTIMRSAE